MFFQLYISSKILKWNKTTSLKLISWERLVISGTKSFIVIMYLKLKQQKTVSEMNVLVICWMNLLFFGGTALVFFSSLFVFTTFFFFVQGSGWFYFLQPLAKLNLVKKWMTFKKFMSISLKGNTTNVSLWN